MKKHRIKKFGVVQTSLIAAIVMSITSLIFVLPMGLFMSVAGGLAEPGFALGGIGMIIVMPFFYFIGTFLMTAIACLLYNWVATWAGGIEFDIEIVDEETEN